MLRRFFSLALLSAICMLAKAEVVEDFLIDYRTTPWNFYVMGYIPSQENSWLTITQPRGTWERVDGEAVYTPNADKDGDGQPDVCSYRLYVADGIPTYIAQDYTVTVYGKADVDASVSVAMLWGWSNSGQHIAKDLNFTTEWSEITVTYPEIGGTSCALVFQPGTQETTFEIQWIKVTHIDDSKPIEWINILENGDAEGEYGDVPCAYSKEYGYNSNEPHPAFIEEVGGEHGKAFVCHATEMVEQPWDNEFWIVSPKSFKKGETVRVTFDCKATKAATSISTQQHASPGAYQHWAAIGNIDFPTEWEEGVGIIKSVEHDGMQSIAFILNGFADANDYYFDNIKWEVMKYENGYFAAGDFCDKVLDDAIQFVYDPDNEVYVCVVGTPEKPASCLKISTKRGNDNLFNECSLKFDPPQDYDDYVQIDDGVGVKWVDFPWPGIWRIELDAENNEIYFCEIPVDDYDPDWADEIETCIIQDGIMYSYNDDTHSSLSVATTTSDLPTSVVIPSTVQGLPVTGIGHGAFSYCTSVTSVTIPESVISIGDAAFVGCSRLTSLIIPESVTTIDSQAFLCCSGLTSIIIPESVTSIGREAFYGCSGLTWVTIPESVINIGTNPFASCSKLSAFYGKYASEDTRYLVNDGCLISFASSGLTEYTIPESVTCVGYKAFSGCRDLTTVTIPESVTSIGSLAFYYCNGLTTIILPPSAEIGEYAFHDLPNLQEVHATGSTPCSVTSNAFYTTPIARCTLFVPKGSREAYAAAEVWRDFGNIVEVESADPYSLEVAETEVVAEQVALIPVSLTNEGGVKGLQCDIHLPAGVEMATDDYGYAYIERSDRTSIHDFGINYTNGCWRIVCTNMRNIEIPAGDGVIFYIPVIAEDNPADLTLSIDNIYLSLTGDVLQPVAPTEGTLHILPAFITGDADGDRAVTVADFTYAVSYILGHEVEGFNFRAADINGDGQVLISDATAILSLVLESGQGGGAASSLPAKAPMATLPILHLSDIQADFDGTATASFTIDGASSYAAVQFDLLLPQGMTVLDVRVADGQRHQALYSNHDGRARVVVFSADNSPLRGDRVLDITFGIDASADGAVAIADGLVVEVATDGIRKYAATGADASVSGIAAATAALRIAVDGRTLLVTAPEAADIVLTGANGVSRRVSLHPGLNRIPLPAPGVYLVGNRKVIAY